MKFKTHQEFQHVVNKLVYRVVAVNHDHVQLERGTVTGRRIPVRISISGLKRLVESGTFFKVREIQ